MKKNVMMRVAAILLVCVLATTCGISGTFAKYVTTGSASDTARVAKWGVELSVSAEGKLFNTEYSETGSVTVKSQTAENVVAPGTADSVGITFTLNGTPEVATKVTATLGDAKDVFLKNGDEIYYPVKFTLVHTYGDGAFSIKPAADAVNVSCVNDSTARTDTITGTLAEIQKVLNQLTANMTKLNPGYVFNDTFTLTWAWEFGDPANNELDTKLGNIAADVGTEGLVAGTDYNLTVAYYFSITIEQVD